MKIQVTRRRTPPPPPPRPEDYRLGRSLGLGCQQAQEETRRVRVEAKTKLQRETSFKDPLQDQLTPTMFI